MTPPAPRSLIPRLCGVLVLLLGIELIAGWLLQVEAMVKILPSSNSVSFNTAVAFVLCGMAMLAAPMDRDGQPRLLRRVMATILAFGAGAILFEDCFDISLGLDWVSMHRVVQDLSPRPGRVAPNTCAALALLAIMLWQSGLPHSARRPWVMSACGLVLVCLVTTGLTGLLLDPTLMYGWYKFNRMAAPTAFGLSLAGIGLYAEFRDQVTARARTSREQERSIVLTGTALLLAMGATAAITTSVIFANQQQASIREQLQTELKSRGKLAEVLIEQSALVSSLDARPLLRSLIERVGQRHDARDAELLRHTLEQSLAQGFSTMTIRWSDGSSPMGAGLAPEAAELALAIPQRPGTALLWRPKGFAFQNVVAVKSPDGRQVAELTTERPLERLSDLYSASTYVVSSAEVVICAPRADDSVACFPSRLHPSPLLLPPATQRRALPVDDAIAGHSAVRTAQDYRGATVVVAYGPLGHTGLSIVSKADTVDIYAPIASLLWRSLCILLGSLVVGVVILRATVGTLARTLARSEARAVESERRLHAITDNVPVLIGFVDKDLTYRFVNATHERWYGASANVMLGKSPRDVMSEAAFALSLPYMQRALAGETVHFDDDTASTGAAYPKHVSVSYIPDLGEGDRVTGFNVLAFDNTESHRQAQDLRHLAHHDSLTGLPNRRLFEDRLSHAMARCQRHTETLGLIYLDIDHFKQINDTLGHEQGDVLLREVARRLTGSVRSSDTVARLGGDEFVVLMEGMKSRDDALIVADKILNAIRRPFHGVREGCCVSTSIGLAYYSGPADSPDQLVQRADAALYEAKAAGRNCYAMVGTAPTAPL